MQKAPSLDRRRFFGAAAATVLRDARSSDLLFRKEQSYEYSCTADGGQ
jgi:hypothetical protein